MIDTNDMRNKLGEALVTPGLTVLALLDEIDRLRWDKQTPPNGKTVRVAVKVAVDKNGDWYFDEDNFKYLMEPRAYYTLTADLPVPEEVTVEAEVHTATNDENATSGGRG